jgi:2-polyprenyl-3-methyl-5-hydroxy-6-metoxy-1,4-benzoquinol methylase
MKHLALIEGSKLLDLGCGDGLLDIWLARWGNDVTAVDRNSSVIGHAMTEDDTKKVTFVTNDLRDVDFETGWYL